jgi:hypothetical protein
LIGIELVHTCPTHAARPGRNEKDIRILDHGSERRIRIFEYELGVRMLLPRGQHRLLVGCKIIHRKLPLLLRKSKHRREDYRQQEGTRLSAHLRSPAAPPRSVMNSRLFSFKLHQMPRSQKRMAGYPIGPAQSAG